MWKHIQNTHIHQESRAALGGREPLGGLRQERHHDAAAPRDPAARDVTCASGTEGRLPPPKEQRLLPEEGRLSRWPWPPPPPRVLSTKSEHA